MTDIERMAKEAGAAVESWLTNPPKVGLYYFTPEQLAKFAALVAEDLAKLCDSLAEEQGINFVQQLALDLASAAIRAKYPMPKADS